MNACHVPSEGSGARFWPPLSFSQTTTAPRDSRKWPGFTPHVRFLISVHLPRAGLYRSRQARSVARRQEQSLAKVGDGSRRGRGPSAWTEAANSASLIATVSSPPPASRRERHRRVRHRMRGPGGRRWLLRPLPGPLPRAHVRDGQDRHGVQQGARPLRDPLKKGGEVGGCLRSTHAGPHFRMQRDGRPRDSEVLKARLIDRPLRPMFQEGWPYDTQVLSWVLSYDGQVRMGSLHHVTVAWPAWGGPCTVFAADCGDQTRHNVWSRTQCGHDCPAHDVMWVPCVPNPCSRRLLPSPSPSRARRRRCSFRTSRSRRRWRGCGWAWSMGNSW